MLSRGDAVVYKCRGLYKVEDIGTLDFLLWTTASSTILFSLWKMQGTRRMFRRRTRQISGVGEPG